MKTYLLSALIICAFSASAIATDVWNGEEYEQNSQPQFLMGTHEADNYFDIQESTNEKIVSYGCGTGRLEEYIAKKAPNAHVIGVEPSPNMFGYAQKIRYCQPNLRFVNVGAQDAEPQSHGLSDADRIYSILALHWMTPEQQQAAFRKAAQSLKQGGIFHVFASDKKGLQNPYELAFVKTCLQKKWKEKVLNTLQENLSKKNATNLESANSVPKIVSIFTSEREPSRDDLELLGKAICATAIYPPDKDELREMAQSANLSIETLEEVPIEHHFETAQEYIPFITPIAKAYGLEKVFGEDFHPYVKASVETYCNEFNPNTDGSIDYKLPMLRLIAKKS